MVQLVIIGCETVVIAGAGYMAGKHAISARRIQQEQTEQMRRLAVVGRVSVRWIHDLANPLTATSLSLGNLDREVDHKSLDHALTATKHMEQLVAEARDRIQGLDKCHNLKLTADERQLVGAGHDR